MLEQSKFFTGSFLEPKADQIKRPTRDSEDRFVFLAGPTGCGKTEISVLLAEALEGEIVSVDSMQVYAGMDIGTAKATLEQQQRTPHHLLDVCPVDRPYNVVDYYYAAQQACDQIHQRGKIPIVVGGAGFYLHALLYGPPSGPPSVAHLRQSLEKEMERIGAEAMYQKVVDQDPDYARTITMHDRHKIIRALEIIELTHGPVSALSWKGRMPIVQGPFRCWFLHRPRQALYQRVEERCDEMIEEGLLQEAETLVAQGLRDNPTAAGAIGYRQCLEFLDSAQTERDWQKCISQFKRASRRYVKRQLTWFRKEPLFCWLDVDAHDPEVVADMMVQDIHLL